MSSWKELASYIIDNLQIILLIVIGLKIGGKLLKAASIVVAVIAFVVIAISIIETAIGCAIPLPEIAGGLNVLQGME